MSVHDIMDVLPGLPEDGNRCSFCDKNSVTLCDCCDAQLCDEHAIRSRRATLCEDCS